MDEEATGRPLVARPGYIVIRPTSPAILRIVSDETSASRLEDIPYIIKHPTPPPTLVRESDSTTA